MELSNEFDVAVPVDEAWKVLTDLERIAPCMPGAELQEVEGDEYRGVVKVRVGPITAAYKGAARLVELDETAHRAVVKAEGRDTRGQGNASASITATLAEAGAGTHVHVVTDLNITGKVAQFGRGVLADVSAKLTGQFVSNLEASVLSPEAADGAGAGAEAAARGSGSPVGTQAGDGGTTGVRKIESAPAEPVDLIEVGGETMARRVAPAVAVVALLFVLRVVIRSMLRRRRS
jgi:carbon monoxide dehydrogenase subunit G